MIDELIQCIYCGEKKPQSREHVLQRSLGGNLILRDVCQACNGGFSNIDQALAEDSLVTLLRVGVTPPDSIVKSKIGGDQLWLDPKDNIWLEIKITNGMTVELLPQIHLREGMLSLHGSDAEDVKKFAALITQKISNNTLRDTFIKTDQQDRCTTTRIAQSRSKELFVRALSAEAGQQFLRGLQEHWDKFRAQILGADLTPTAVANVQVQVRQSICLDDMYRAITKIAFEMLAHRKGSTFVLRPEFNSVRKYIQGLDIIHKDPASEGTIAVDTRFVTQLPFGKTIGATTAAHLVQFFYYHPKLYSIVTLYGKLTYLVLLGEIEISNPLMEQLADAHEFSIDRTTNKPVGILELASRMVAQATQTDTPRTEAKEKK